MPPTDHDLISATGSRASAAFEELVRRWQTRLVRVLARLGPVTPVDDLCQEVWLKVYVARRRYRPVGAFSTWLYRIALNTARDDFRRRTGVEPRQIEVGCEASSDGPETIAIRREDEERVQQAISRLSDKVREAVVLKHFGELTFAEVADVLGVPLSTVKSRVELGLDELQTLLRPTVKPAQERHHEL